MSARGLMRRTAPGYAALFTAILTALLAGRGHGAAPAGSTTGDAVASFGPDGALLIQPDRALLRPPTGTVSVPPGKSWFTAPREPMNATFNQIVQALRDGADPTRALVTPGDAVRISSATDDTLDGTPSVRYQISLDAGLAAQRHHYPAVPKALADAVASGGLSAHTTLWLDAARSRRPPRRLAASDVMRC